MKHLASNNNQEVTFPLVADQDKKVSQTFSLIHGDSQRTIRSVFIIDPKRRVRFILNCPFQVKRDFHFILKSLEDIQKEDEKKEQ